MVFLWFSYGPTKASSVHAQLLRCVKALGAFDLQLLQLCPEITPQGLVAMQVGLQLQGSPGIPQGLGIVP